MNTPTANLALTNLTYCSHADLHGFVVPGTKLYLASIADSFVLFGFVMIPFLGFVLNWELEFVLRCKERRKKIFGFVLRREHRLGERDRLWGERKNQLKKWEEREKLNKKIINHMPHFVRTMPKFWGYCSMLQKIWHLEHLINGVKLCLGWDMCQIFSIWQISYICCGCSKKT